MKKVVLIGFGRRGKTILGALLGVPNVCITGIFDLDTKFNAPSGISKFEKEEEIFKQKPDLVIISTPPSSHLKYIKACNRFKIPVLCEKPLVSKLSELAEIVKLKIKIYTAYQLVHDSFICKAIDLSKSQKIYSINASQRVSLSPAGWKNNKKTSGGGTLIDNCSHFINLAITHFGLPSKASALLSFSDQGIEKQSDVILFYNGFNFKIHSDWVSAVSKENSIVIHGENYDINYYEDNNFAELFTLSSKCASLWSTKTKTAYYIAKGLERNLKDNSFNIISDKKAIDNMLQAIFTDLDKENSQYYKNQLFAAIKTNEIIGKLYESNNKIIDL